MSGNDKKAHILMPEFCIDLKIVEVILLIQAA